MNKTIVVKSHNSKEWLWPINISCYDRSITLTDEEIIALTHEYSKRNLCYANPAITRLIEPLNFLFELITSSGVYTSTANNPIRYILQHVLETKVSYWSWTVDDWANCISSTQHTVKGQVAAAAYLLGKHPDLPIRIQASITNIYCRKVAAAVFSKFEFERSLQTIQNTLKLLGYSVENKKHRDNLPDTVAILLLYCLSPRLEDVTDDKFSQLYDLICLNFQHTKRESFSKVSVALRNLGILHKDYNLMPSPGDGRYHNNIEAGVSQDWFNWVERWSESVTLNPGTKKHRRLCLLKVGRWLAQSHPEVTSPSQWDKRLAVEFIAALNNWKIGDFTVRRTNSIKRKPGQELGVLAKKLVLSAIRSFLCDLQNWEWIQIRFNPHKVLRTPATWQALAGPKPHERIIEPDLAQATLGRNSSNSRGSCHYKKW